MYPIVQLKISVVTRMLQEYFHNWVVLIATSDVVLNASEQEMKKTNLLFIVQICVEIL